MSKNSLLSGDQIKQISRYLDEWISQVEAHNNNSYFDINKDSENLSRQLLNIIFNLKLKNLNDSKPNFPHIDLGDHSKKIAFSVTSRIDLKKFKTDSLGFMKKHKDTFPIGIKFFILKKTADKLKRALQKKSYKPSPDFNIENDILSIKELKQQLPSLSHEKRKSILEILQKEIKTIPEEIDIDINIKNIDNENIGRYNLNKNFDLNYKRQEKIDLIKITPRTKHFLNLEKLNKIQLTDYPKNKTLGIQFPTIDITMNNNTNNTFLLKKLTLIVNKSKKINKPLILLFLDEWFPYEFTIQNEGWEMLTKVSLIFDILEEKNKTNSIPKNFRYKKTLPNIIESARINIYEEIVDFYKNLLKKPFISAKDQTRRKFVYIIGKIEFTSNKQEQSLSFKIKISLFEGDPGMGFKTKHRYTALLKENKQNYKVDIPTCESLKPKDHLRLSLLLSCFRHTKHNFKIRFEFTNYFQETKPIELELFYPRYFKDEAYFEYLEKTEKMLIQKEIF